MANARKAALRGGVKPILHQRRLHHDYTVLRSYEAGLVLAGSEVKSLRTGAVQWGDAHGRIDDQGELWLHGLHIEEYPQATGRNHEPTARRKLLLHRHEIDQIAGSIKTQGCALVPARLYLKDGRVKVELCLARGKVKGDRRQDLRRREQDRDIARALARRGR
jgi:SsrA-binding protein